MAFSKEDMGVFAKYFPYVCMIAIGIAYLRKDGQYTDLQNGQIQFWRDAFIRTNEAYINRPRDYEYRESSGSQRTDSIRYRGSSNQ